MARKLRVKLITIPWELQVPSLALACLAAVTPQDRFEVCIVDLLRERLVLDEPVDLVGITASTPRIKAAYALADFYRRRGVKVVIGGHHVTALPEEGLEHADAVVCGEGETSWQRICEQMLTNPAQVAGIYKDDPPDLTTLPVPRVDLMKIDRYQPYYYPIIATRGCPELCGFCFAKRMTRGYRTYPIRNVIEQVRRRPTWVKTLYFVDDNLAGDLDYTFELFRELKRLKVPFGMQVRHEFSQDPRNIQLAREAGCALISSGYESINQKSLDRTGKRATAALYKEIIHNIQQAGIIASGNWMFGFDWDTPDLFEESWEFVRDSGIFHCCFSAEIPFPGTPSFRRYQSEGRILTTDYDQYIGKDRVVHIPKQMTAQQLQKGIRWLTLKYYSPAHRWRVNMTGLRNRRFMSEFPEWQRIAILTALNSFQVWMWHYRMMPALRWLYFALLPANKYRYVMDVFRGTNFWSQEHRAADPGPFELDTSSPFAHQMGTMKHRRTRLVPVSGAAAAASLVGDSAPDWSEE